MAPWKKNSNEDYFRTMDSYDHDGRAAKWREESGGWKRDAAVGYQPSTFRKVKQGKASRSKGRASSRNGACSV